MVGLAKSVQYLWALSVGIECLLLAWMLARKHYRGYPAFFFYLVFDILHSLNVFVVYQIWGFRTRPAMYLAWTSQALVLCARAVAVAELCRHLLRPFRGIWVMASRLLILCAALVAGYSVLTSGWKWYETILRMNIGLELAMLVVIVCLFLFARYYEVVAEKSLQTMGAGFFVLSCSKVVNDTILQHRMLQYANLWRLLGSLAFLASLSLWFSALYKLAPAPAPRPILLPADIYRSLAPAMNQRLRQLNAQLNRFWRLGTHGS